MSNKTTFTEKSLHYGYWKRRFDAKNAKKDRKKDVDNYRKNKKTKYLKTLDAELNYTLEQEENSYKKYIESIEKKVILIEQKLIGARDGVAKPKLRKEEIENQLNDSDNPVEKARLESEIHELNAIIENAQDTLDDLNGTINGYKKEISDSEKVLKRNKQVIQQFFNLRASHYVNILFKKVNSNGKDKK